MFAINQGIKKVKNKNLRVIFYLSVIVSLMALANIFLLKPKVKYVTLYSPNFHSYDCQLIDGIGTKDESPGIFNITNRSVINRLSDRSIYPSRLQSTMYTLDTIVNQKVITGYETYTVTIFSSNSIGEYKEVYYVHKKDSPRFFTILKSLLKNQTTWVIH